MDSDLDAADLRGRRSSIEPSHHHHQHQQHLQHEHDYDQEQHHNHDLNHHTYYAHNHQPYEYDIQPPDPSSHRRLTSDQGPSTLPYHHQHRYDDITTSAHHHALNAVDPDDFYKSYPALQYDSTPDSLPMASSTVPRPSLRSNGDGTTPRHPVVSPKRNVARPNNVRSASNPVDNKAVAGMPRSAPSNKPSVKDLKKRFDQNPGSTSSIPRAPARPGSATRVKREAPHSAGANTGSKSRDRAPSYSTLRGGVAQESPDLSSSSRSQRSRFVAEDQVSSNAQSFASRVGKPRSSAGANPNTSQTMAHLSPNSSPQPSANSPPVTLPSQGLLFGEILPEQCDTSALGFGIDSLRPRGAPEPDTGSTWLHQRSLSDHDIEPSSPSNWYRDVDTANTQDNDSHPDQSSTTRNHGRSQSDVATKKQPPITRKRATRNPPSSTNTPASPASKLPLSVRKLNSPANSSPDSTRPNSPSTLKRPQANGKSSRAATPSSRSRTPTSSAKTPTRSTAARKGPSQGLPTPNSSTRLQAYIEAPPPKLSPPLRSSRPRQPVSVATTASSRMKAVDKPMASNNTRFRANMKTPEPETRRRKISVGPIDFEQRREHIRLAYSKSMRESQALEARKKAAERKRLELEAAAKARAAELAAMTSSAESADHTVTGEPSAGESPVERPLESPDVPQIEMSLDREAQSIDDVSSPSCASPTHDELPTPTKQAPILQPPLQTSHSNSESPTLGVPGSFPALSPPINTDEAPPSAVSATSGITEFDNEPQEISPLSPESPQKVPIAIVKPPSPQATVTVHTRAEYHYPFEDEPDEPDAMPARQEATQDIHDRVPFENNTYPTIPGAFEDDYGTDDSPTTYQLSTCDTAEAPSIAPDDESTVDEGRHQVPFPRIEMQEESDCHSEYEEHRDLIRGIPLNHEDAATDTCTEDTDDQGRTEDCHSESQFDEQLSSYRQSSCASSDAGIEEGYEDLGRYEQVAGGGSNNLVVPITRANRISQQSQWTDLTVESPNPSDHTQSPYIDDPEPESPTYGHVTIFGSSVISRDSEVPSRDSITEPPSVRPSCSSTESSAYLEQHQLPEVDAGEDFTIPYLSAGPVHDSPYMPSPDHEPPPIPTPASGSVLDSRRTSGVFDPSQYSTRFNSGRGSEDFMSQLETPQTLDSVSLSTPEQYFGAATHDSDVKAVAQDGTELTDKERHRLVQRRNVIKELVDTEAVFVRDMNIVEEIYKGTAEACPKLDSKTVKQIFRNTDEIIAFHTLFLTQIKDAVVDIYVPKHGRSAFSREDNENGQEQAPKTEISDARDRTVLIGHLFKDNIENMKNAHEGFLRSSDQAAKSLIQIQQDPTVKVWLNECNEVAKDLTAAWDLDSLLIKPMQRITKYPNLIITLLQHTPQDHPDREPLTMAKDIIETAILEINKTKKNFELVGQIVGRKRKESDVKNGFARAFGKRVDKLQTAGNRPPEDPEYAKLNEKFGDDYLRLQVVLRDVEFYTRQVSTYVREFLQYLSSVELVMRLQPGSYPELESKWVQFNISIRDLEKVALEDHLAQVRRQVIEPFEQVIKAYGNPSLAMKKRQKRRLDYERMEQLKRSGKSAADSKLQELVEQYEALNDTLKKELPKLSALTEKVGNICLGNFVNIQARWFGIWKDKMKTVLGDCPDLPDVDEIVSTFQRDFPYVDEQMASIGICNPVPKGRPSQSTAASGEDGLSKMTRSPRPSDVDTLRSRNLSINGDMAPSLPTPDFGGRNSVSGSLSMSPTGSKSIPSPHQYYYRDFYAGIAPQSGSGASMTTPEAAGSSRSDVGTGQASTRPSTGRSFDSGGVPRQSSESTSQPPRDSHTTYNSTYPPQESRRFSGLFHSALPMPDGPEESRRSSRASSRERGPLHDGYNVLWLAASLFEFNIATTKHEAGYPYLIYQAGEIFDVIAEKGELWLAKNQDDPTEQVGWIWSKHFAKLADS